VTDIPEGLKNADEKLKKMKLDDLKNLKTKPVEAIAENLKTVGISTPESAKLTVNATKANDAKKEEAGGSSAWIWWTLGVLAVGGGAGFFLYKRK